LQGEGSETDLDVGEESLSDNLSASKSILDDRRVAKVDELNDQL
jgi:hypothetical protein